MLTLLLSCTGTTPTLPAPYAAEVDFLVERGVLSNEQVSITTAGVFDGAEHGLFYARGDDGLQELVLLTGALDGPGDYEVLQLRYRKGQQYLDDSAAECSLSLDVLADGESSGGFACTGLIPEEDLGDPEVELWALSGTWFGGTLTQEQTKPALLAQGAYRTRVEWVAEDGSVQSQEDQAILLPWQSGQWWTLFGTRPDESLDLLLRLDLSDDQIKVRRAASSLSVGAVQLRVESDSEISASLSDEEQRGTELLFELWPDVQVGEEEQKVRIF